MRRLCGISRARAPSFAFGTASAFSHLSGVIRLKAVKQSRRGRHPYASDIAQLLALGDLFYVPAVEITATEVPTVPLIAKPRNRTA